MPLKRKVPSVSPPPTEKEIAMKTDSDNFIKDYVLDIENLLQNPDQIPREFLTDIFKELWKTYPQGLSYFMNYYMYKGKVDEHINAFLVDGFYTQFLEHFIDFLLNSNEFKERLAKFNSEKNTKYGEFIWQEFTLNVFDLVLTDNTLLYGKKRNTTEILDLFIKFFIESFRNPSIASAVNSGSAVKVVYRGIVGLTLEDKSKLLTITKSFTSTSKLLGVALRHTTFMPSRIQNDISKRVILEMHLDPNIKIVDYNALIPKDLTNEWQNEVILPPGLHFKELGTSTLSETITVKGKDNKSQHSHKETDTCDVLVVSVSAHSFSHGGTRFKKVTLK